MKNKILIKVYILCLAEEFELYIPTNESIKGIINLIIKSVFELSDGRLNINDVYCLLESETNTLYPYSLIVRDTNIKNGKKLILI